MRSGFSGEVEAIPHKIDRLRTITVLNHPFRIRRDNVKQAGLRGLVGTPGHKAASATESA